MLCLVLDNKSFIIYSTTILFQKNFQLFFLQPDSNPHPLSSQTNTQLFSQSGHCPFYLCPKISFQYKINNKYFSLPIFTVTLSKTILIISRSDSIINFKLRAFRIRFHFFSQSRIMSINRFSVNRIMIRIIALIY